MKKELDLTDVDRVLDGQDMNQDLHQLLGYVFSLGTTERVFPSSHLIQLAERFLEKHRKLEE